MKVEQARKIIGRFMADEHVSAEEWSQMNGYSIKNDLIPILKKVRGLYVPAPEMLRVLENPWEVVVEIAEAIEEQKKMPIKNVSIYRDEDTGEYWLCFRDMPMEIIGNDEELGVKKWWKNLDAARARLKVELGGEYR